MSKIEFALQTSLVLAIATYGLVNAQTRNAPPRDTRSSQPGQTNQSQISQSETAVEANAGSYRQQNFGLVSSPEDAKKFYKQGVKYGNLKLYDEAVAAFELAILLKPNYADAYFGLGHAYSDLGRWKEAIQAFRRAIQLNPKDDEAYVRLKEATASLAREEKTNSQPESRGVQRNTPAGEKVSLDSHSSPNTANPSKPKSANRSSDTTQKESASSTFKQPVSQPPKETANSTFKTSGTRSPSNVQPKSGSVSSPSPQRNTVSKGEPGSSLNTPVRESSVALKAVANRSTGPALSPNADKNSVQNLNVNKNSEPAAPRTLTNSRSEIAAVPPKPLNKEPTPAITPNSRSSPVVRSTLLPNPNSSEKKATLKAHTNPVLPATSAARNPVAKIGPDPKTILNTVETTATTVPVGEIPAPSRSEIAAGPTKPLNKQPTPTITPDSGSSPVARSTLLPNPNSSEKKATLKAQTNPVLPAVSAARNPVAKIAPDPKTILNTVETTATTVPVGEIPAPQPALAPSVVAEAAKPAPEKKQSNTPPNKGQDLAGNAIPGPPPIKNSGGEPTGVAEKRDEATVKTSAAAAPETGASTSEIPKSSEVATYRVGIGDVLEVRVSDAPAGNPTLFTVSAGGLLDYPVLNEPLGVLGLTPEEVGEKLRNELKRRALSEDQKINVAVHDYNSHTILVSGLVSEQGTKVLRREAIPLYVVLAEAQPLPEAGRVTVILRPGTKTVGVDFGTPEAMALLIHPGDVVLVQAKPKLFFYIGGEVKEPGEKPFREDLKLTQAILIAGGLSRDSKAAELAREGANGMLEVTIYKFSEINSGKVSDPLIQPGDRITILH